MKLYMIYNTIIHIYTFLIYEKNKTVLNRLLATGKSELQKIYDRNTRDRCRTPCKSHSDDMA